MLFLEKANKRESTWNNSIIVTAWVLLDVVDLAQLGRAVPSSVELSSTGGKHCKAQPKCPQGQNPLLNSQ